MARVNPFKPNSPVNPGMFVGRLAEVERLEAHLVQARAGNPSNFMITGERGIGKSSLLNYFKWVAEGKIGIGTEQEREDMKFLVLDTDVDSTTSQFTLIRKFDLALRKELAESEPARAFLNKVWGFVERIEAKGLKLGRPAENHTIDDLLFDEFAYSLSETVERICDDAAPTLFNAKYDGVVILIDEADSGAKALQLGGFCKLLTERLERRSCNHVVLGLAGLGGIRSALSQSHASAPRLFDEISLGRLSDDEVNLVVDFCLERALQDNGTRTVITDGARKHIVAFSEGYPHFVQQFGFSAFSADDDNVVDEKDFREGAFGKQGALEKIGDRYYRDNFYNKILQDSYRQVLHVMALHLDSWVTKAQIRANFKGKTTTLDNALHALRERGIILSKEGARGVYRLQHKGFAVWIKLHKTDPDTVERSVPEPSTSDPN